MTFPTFSPTNYSLIILPLNAMWPAVLAVWLHKQQMIFKNAYPVLKCIRKCILTYCIISETKLSLILLTCCVWLRRWFRLWVTLFKSHSLCMLLLRRCRLLLNCYSSGIPYEVKRNALCGDHICTSHPPACLWPSISVWTICWIFMKFF